MSRLSKVIANGGELHPMQTAFKENHGSAMRVLYTWHDYDRHRYGVALSKPEW